MDDFLNYYHKVDTVTGFFVVKPGEVLAWDESTIRLIVYGKVQEVYDKVEWLAYHGNETGEPPKSGCLPCQSQWKPKKKGMQ